MTDPHNHLCPILLIQAKPTVKLLKRAATLKCKLDALVEFEDQMKIVYEISGSDASYKYEPGKNPRFYFSSEGANSVESSVSVNG